MENRREHKLKLNFKNKLKNLIFPITFLTIITICAIIVTIQALYVAFTNDHTAAIYTAVTIPITLIIIFFYVIDRLLIKKVSYLKLMIGEFVFGLIIFLIFYYQDGTSAINNSTTINFYTDQDFILVLFDSNKNSLLKFHKKGDSEKVLNVYNTNIIHIDHALSFEKNFRVNYPKHWERSSAERGTLQTEGDSIEYIYASEHIFNISYLKNSEAFIDSLLKLEKRK